MAAGEARYFVILVVDIERFGRRPNPVQLWLRGCLYELLERALHAAGIDPRGAPPPADRGDGLFWLLPGSVPKTALLGPFTDHLEAGLRAHARTSSADGALRLRVVLHAGEVAWDGKGWVGADLNTACRMVDLDPLRRSLAAARGAGHVLAVSDPWHDGVVRHGYPGIDPTTFAPVTFDAKELAGARVWVRAPGHATPPGLARRDGAAGETTPGAPGAPAHRPPAHRPPVPEPGAVTFHNAGGTTVGQQVGVNHGDVTQHWYPAAPAAPHADLRQQLDELRAALKEALAERRIDAGTFHDATEELDEAERQAAGDDPESRGRLLRALRKLRGLVEDAGGLASAVTGLITAVRGER